jgi:hypothetical protein
LNGPNRGTGCALGARYHDKKQKLGKENDRSPEKHLKIKINADLEK